jgi:CRISPR-associated protein Cas1
LISWKNSELPLADRLVLTLINRNQLSPDDFIERPGGAIYMEKAARKTVLSGLPKAQAGRGVSHRGDTKVPLGLVAPTPRRG